MHYPKSTLRAFGLLDGFTIYFLVDERGGGVVLFFGGGEGLLVQGSEGRGQFVHLDPALAFQHRVWRKESGGRHIG